MTTVNFQVFGLLLLALFGDANAQFFNFFNGQQNQGQQPQRSFEDDFLNNGCDGYLCPDTKNCVKAAIDCPCPFPKSQIKCILPDNQNFVCISKPATNDPSKNKVYDDPSKASKASFEGYRDCGWVTKAYNGLV